MNAEAVRLGVVRTKQRMHLEQFGFEAPRLIDKAVTRSNKSNFS